MSSLVLDASMTLSWCFEEEASEGATALLDRLQRETAAVPMLWHLEIANTLVLAERRRRITIADASRFLALLNALTIETDEETVTVAFGPILALARQQSLTAYDAAYLELSMRLGVPLATRDSALINAAARLGVPVVGPV